MIFFNFLLGSFLQLIFTILNTYHILAKKVKNTFQKLAMLFSQFQDRRRKSVCAFSSFWFLRLLPSRPFPVPPPNSHVGALSVEMALERSDHSWNVGSDPLYKLGTGIVTY